MARAQSVLELSVYQVSPTDLLKALELLTKIQTKNNAELAVTENFNENELNLNAQELLT